MTKHIFSIFAFMVVSLAVQGLSHFVANKAHFATVGFMRSDPLIPLGLFVMVVQGLTMTLALTRLTPEGVTIRDGMTLSLTFGLFLAAYIAIVEPSKYAVPSISAWVMVEGTASLTQFTVFGFLLGFIHQKMGKQYGSR